MAGYLVKSTRAILQKHAQDIVFLSAFRTPVTRAFKGGLKDAHDHELLSHVLEALVDRHPRLDNSRLDAVCIGTVLSELGGSKAGRMAALHAGLSHASSFSTVNQACASGLAAINRIAHSLAMGECNVAIGGGMESMTRNYGSRAVPTQLWPALRESDNKDARDCIMPMGLTAENVARRYGISRADQDAFAAQSQARALAAQQNGFFDQEIVPIRTTWRDPKDEHADAIDIEVAQDDGVRTTSVEKLASMKPAFADDGTATAGNSSQISDGAAAALMTRRSTAEELGLEGAIVAKWAGAATVGCRPNEMGVGPVYAVPALLSRMEVRREEVDVWELNEAFASQALHCLHQLGLDTSEGMEKVNPCGGAIALGHPLGATGARQLATLIPEMRRRDARLGVITMCVGTGMGSAALIVRE